MSGILLAVSDILIPGVGFLTWLLLCQEIFPFVSFWHYVSWRYEFLAGQSGLGGGLFYIMPVSGHLISGGSSFWKEYRYLIMLWMEVWVYTAEICGRGGSIDRSSNSQSKTWGVLVFGTNVLFPHRTFKNCMKNHYFRRMWGCACP
jgi:hypothetical protein